MGENDIDIWILISEAALFIEKGNTRQQSAQHETISSTQSETRRKVTSTNKSTSLDRYLLKMILFFKFEKTKNKENSICSS